jgi:hypothetical protein
MNEQSITLNKIQAGSSDQQGAHILGIYEQKCKRGKHVKVFPTFQHHSGK